MTRAQLLAYIDNNVYPNANNEITALMVRDVLHEMVGFMGDAATYGVGPVGQNEAGLVTGGNVYAAINTALSAAIKFQGVTTTALTDGNTNPNVTIDGATYTAVRGDEVIYGSKEFLWTGSKWQQLGDEQSWALKTITITAGTGLTGGGDLTANRTLSLSSDTVASIGSGVTAYGWGNHADAGYLLASTAASTYQPIIDDLDAIRSGAAAGATAVQPGSIKTLTLKVGTATIGSAYNPIGSSNQTLTIAESNLTALLDDNYHPYGGSTTLNTFKIGGATFTWHPQVGTTPGYLELNSAFLSAGDQIVVSGTPGGGSGGGAGYLYELGDVYTDANHTKVLRPTGADRAAGDLLSFDASHGWVALPQSSLGVAISQVSGLQSALDNKANASALAGYVSAVALNGNHLRVTKGGTNTDLTIPYATVTSGLQRFNGSNTSGGYDLNTMLNGGGITSNYGATSYWGNAPAGALYGGAIQFNTGGDIPIQFLWDINHNSTSSTRNLWFRSANNLGWQNDWKQIIHSGNIGSQSVSYATSAGNADTLDGQHGSYYQPKVSALGSSIKPVYVSASGTFSESSTYAGGTSVTLNGTSKAGTTASFYATTSAGTTGQILKATTSGAPIWTNSDLGASNKPIYLNSSGVLTEGVACLPLTGGTLSADDRYPLAINDTNTNGGYVGIMYRRGSSNLGLLGFTSADTPVFINAARSATYKLWHEGNSNLTSVPWSAQSLTLAGAITGATTGAFSSNVSVGGTLTVGAPTQNFYAVYAPSYLSFFTGTYTGGWNAVITVPNGAIAGAYLTGGTTITRYWYGGADYNSAALNILPSGNVGIGTTSPAYKLDVNGNAHFSAIYGSQLAISRTLDGAYAFSIGNKTGTNGYIFTAGGGEGYFEFHTNVSGTVAVRVTIANNGTLSTTGDQVISSDINLKKNIKDLDLTVEQIAQLPAVTFDWKDGRGSTFGTVAQGVLPIFPQAVRGNEGNYSVVYGQGGWVFGVKNARAIVDIQAHETEQDKEIKRLKARVAELEKRLRMN